MTKATVPDGMSFWDGGADVPASPQLVGDTTADVAIVGAGFSGLSAAYHLVRERPDLDVVVLESQRAGSGASGRNTGILRPGIGGSVLDLCRRFGEQEGARLYQASVDAVGAVRDLIGREGMQCEIEDVPHIKLGLTTRQADHLHEEAETLARLGFRSEYHDRRGLVGLVPVPARGGLAYPGSAQLNPARLTRELKRVALERGVRLFEDSPVTSFTPGSRVRLETPQGTLDATKVVMATNAHAAQLGVLGGQVIPMQTHVSVSAPLSDEQLGTLAWKGRSSFSDKRQVFDYYRLTGDNRIMFGGGRPAYRAAKGDRKAGMTGIADPEVWRAQRRLFSEVFPSLGDVPIVGQWAGTVGMTLDRLPVVGALEHAPGVVYAGAWNGHGVAMATASGALVADLLLDRSGSEPGWPWLRGRAPVLPPDPLRAAGLSAYLTMLQLLDRVDFAADRFVSRPRVNPSEKSNGWEGRVSPWTRTTSS